MKRTALILAAIAALGSVAQADQSDRYNDLRFDSAIGHIDFTDDASATTQTDRRTFGAGQRSTRSDRTRSVYAYANPYGVGPNNDSR